MTKATLKTPPPAHRLICQCEHCRELAAISPGLAAAHRWPHPHTREADELIAAARDVARRRKEVI